jgi:hypothetical protein
MTWDILWNCSSVLDLPEIDPYKSRGEAASVSTVAAKSDRSGHDVRHGAARPVAAIGRERWISRAARPNRT